MPSYNFTDLYHDSSAIVGMFGDWYDSETLALTFSDGARFSDAQVYEGYHLSYPQIIPANATITSLRIIVYAQTGFSNADLRCALSLNQDWDSAYALVHAITKSGDDYIFDFADDGLIQTFLNSNGGIAALNSYSFGCALFNVGHSGGAFEPDYMTVTNVRMEIDFTAPAVNASLSQNELQDVVGSAGQKVVFYKSQAVFQSITSQFTAQYIPAVDIDIQVKKGN